MLLAALGKQDYRGVLIQFWQVSREDNEANPYAKPGTSAEKERALMK